MSPGMLDGWSVCFDIRRKEEEEEDEEGPVIGFNAGEYMTKMC